MPLEISLAYVYLFISGAVVGVCIIAGRDALKSNSRTPRHFWPNVFGLLLAIGDTSTIHMDLFSAISSFVANYLIGFVFGIIFESAMFIIDKLRRNKESL